VTLPCQIHCRGKIKQSFKKTNKNHGSLVNKIAKIFATVIFFR